MIALDAANDGWPILDFGSRCFPATRGLLSLEQDEQQQKKKIQIKKGAAWLEVRFGARSLRRCRINS